MRDFDWGGCGALVVLLFVVAAIIAGIVYEPRITAVVILVGAVVLLGEGL